MIKRIPRRVAVTLAILSLSLGIPLGVSLASHQFSDVPNSNIFHADIEAIANSGVTTGCGGGRYCPSDFVTREQMAAFMNRLGALGPGKVPVVNADKIDGLDSAAFSRPMFAVVNADGSFVRGAGVVSSSRVLLQTGRYQVNFNRSVGSCAYTASIGDPADGVAGPGMISVATRFLEPNAVFVETQNALNADADLPFHLHVSCVPGSGTVTLGAPPAGSSSSQDGE